MLCDIATTAGLIAEEQPRGLPGFGQGGGDLLVHDIHPGTRHCRGRVRCL